jgi:hypothetical protein
VNPAIARILTTAAATQLAVTGICKRLCIEAMTGYFRGPKSPNARRVDPTRSAAPTGAEPSFADEGGDGG